MERPDVAGLVERAERGRPSEFAPQLEVDEGVRLPLIHAGVFAERLLVHGNHRGRLQRRTRRQHSEENGDARYSPAGEAGRPVRNDSK